MAETKSSIIIDNGSGSIKAGFSGEEEPLVDFPTLIGRVKNQLGTEKMIFILVKKLKKKMIS